MFNFEILLAVFGVFAFIVGTAVIILVIAAAFLWPATRLFKRIVHFFQDRLRGRKATEYTGWTSHFDDEVKQGHQRAMIALGFEDEPTQTILPPPTFEEDMTAITDVTHPGLSYLAGRPIEARHDKPDFMDSVTTMHHQI